MKVALAVAQLTPDRAANMAEIERLTRDAARQGAALVLFAEMALTGFMNNDEPEHDRQLAVTVPGPETEQVAKLARECAIYLALGLLEREGNEFYDAALLFGPDGRNLLKYRRISPSWHGRGANPAIYREGDSVPTCDTPLGSFAFLICGDIFFDEITDRARAAKPDCLLFPLARGIDEDVHSDQEWYDQEIAVYGERVKCAGAPTLLVNYVSEMDNCFGGAVAFAADGSFIASHTLRQPGVLVVDLPEPGASAT